MGTVHQRLVGARLAVVRFGVLARLGVVRLAVAFDRDEPPEVEEREDDDVRDVRLAGVRFVVAEAPVRGFLGAMSP